MGKIGENHVANMLELGRQELIAANSGQKIEIPPAEPPQQSFEQMLQSRIDASAGRSREPEGMER